MDRSVHHVSQYQAVGRRDDQTVSDSAVSIASKQIFRGKNQSEGDVKKQNHAIGSVKAQTFQIVGAIKIVGKVAGRDEASRVGERVLYHHGNVNEARIREQPHRQVFDDKQTKQDQVVLTALVLRPAQVVVELVHEESRLDDYEAEGNDVYVCTENVHMDIVVS